MAHRVPRRAQIGAAAVFVVALSAAITPAGHAAATPPRYRPPVDAPVADPFRPPATRFGPGNRGIDYATEPGTPVRAIGDGEVIFAGPVAGTLHVTVRHPDGLRSSYSFLEAVGVRVGARVRQGEVVGTAGPMLHLGIRDRDGTYLDPAVLFAGDLPARVRLVPGLEEGEGPLRERRALLTVILDHLDSPYRLAGMVVDASGQRARLLLHYAVELRVETRLARIAMGMERWRRSRGDCTPPTAPPPRPAGRRIAILVAGFGSTSEGSGIDRTDTAALGYAPGDVVRFSYRGGRIPAEGLTDSLAALPARPYDELDSQGELREAASRLEALIAAVSRAEPGVPIDLIAHSQGGVVTRLAIGEAFSRGRLPAEVRTFVTLGTPHGGADLATALGALDELGGFDAQLAALAAVVPGGHDPASPAARQLSEVSDLTRQVAATPVPDHLRMVSIAASGDWVVPGPRTLVDGERHVTVDLHGLSAHDELPGSPAATREIALAVAGLPPTCVGAGQAASALVEGETISFAIDAAGAAGALAGMSWPGP
ncbi:peptidoglycan DD-metalloendopeptidase family protein [Rhabdothermincola sediminis]|uniref:peptidoglycan DD-metalloendopeptidase family protein n=1 Tax=Rhabdothermincola sediminis TaxID=2751370 RepID=UPI001AA0A679|nr:peptidoglycan DD-metalloendopeptidase family protein [Rhabdothermincola sediminis]